MPVLRYLMAVGVSGTIVLFNVGQGEAVPSPVESQDRSSDHPLTQESTLKHKPTKFVASQPDQTPIIDHQTNDTSLVAGQIDTPTPELSLNHTMGEALSSDGFMETPPNLVKHQAKSPNHDALAPSTDVNSSTEISSESPSVEVAISDNSHTQSAIENNPTPPVQLSQVETPEIQIPDLTPPREPYPQRYPDGTLRTEPPSIVLPSTNPLYFPTQPGEVEIEETVPITLEQAFDLVRRNSPEIQVLQLQLDQNLAGLRVAQAELFPSLSFTSSLTRSETAGATISTRAQNRRIRNQRRQAAARGEVDTTPFQIPFGSTSFDNSLQIQYDFGLNGARGSRIREAQQQLRAAELELERVIEESYLNVAQTYYNLQAADAEVEIQRAAVRNAQKSLEDAEALERAGVGTRFEVLQARVTLASTQQDLTNAISTQRTSRRNLVNLLNVSQNVNLVAADPISLAGTWEFTLNETIILAYRNRPELETQLVNRNLAEERRRQALSATRPNLTGSASYNVLGQLSDDANAFAAQGWADGYNVQLQLRWNFFDGGAARSRARQQELGIAIAEERFSQTRNQIRREIEEAFFNLQASFENIGVANLGVEEATEALRLARLRFQAGVGTQTDVINQETSLTRAQNQLLRAIIGYNRALAQLRRFVSNLPDNILQDQP
ncbi:MAG: TolC family protein [Arthrospira sp. SH-MAG29]|nr:TolC family protein [Arthrospira sp. SH-MAG29]MBS0016391.1 TolC family protein [Arthrospira sp. SH-MAG29]